MTGILSAALLLVSCADSNRRYVRKAVRIMDKQGIMATDSRWWEEYECVPWMRILPLGKRHRRLYAQLPRPKINSTAMNTAGK